MVKWLSWANTGSSELSAIGDHAFGFGLSLSGALFVECFNDILSFDDFSVDAVFAVEPGALHEGDEELGSVGVGAGVGHREEVGLGVLDFEVLVGKLLSVDGLAAGSVVFGEVTALGHEVSDDSVETASFVAETMFSGAEGSEVFGSLGGDVVVEFEDDSACGLAVDGDVEENFGSGHIQINLKDMLLMIISNIYKRKAPFLSPKMQPNQRPPSW